MQESVPSVVINCQDHIAKSVGLWFSPDRAAEFSRGVAATCRDLDISEKALWELLHSGDRDAEIRLTENLTIGETYFYRDTLFFDRLEQKIVTRDFAASSIDNKRLRIWCAGCSTGEEPYSVAIALRRCLLGLDQWKVSIMATDLNSRSLEKARRGVYGNWSFRNSPDWLLPRYFQETAEKKKKVLPFVSELVTFQQLNLAKGHFPSAFNGTKDMDLVICRNVLMYLEPGDARQAVAKFYEALVPGGYLVLSPVDGGLVADLELVSEEGGFYRKPAPAETKKVTYLFPQPEQRKETEAETETEVASEQATLDRAKRLLAGGFWEPAEAILRPLVEGAPDHEHQSQILLAFSLAQQSRLEEAEQTLLTLIDQRVVSTLVYRLLASCFHLQGESRKAEEQLRKALYLEPEDASTHQLQGLVLYDDKPERAKKHFAKAAELSTRSLVGLSPLELSGVAL